MIFGKRREWIKPRSFAKERYIGNGFSAAVVNKHPAKLHGFLSGAAFCGFLFSCAQTMHKALKNLYLYAKIS